MKVLLVGHACSPCHGSEPAFTWNWARHLSRDHEVWALVHPHERWAVEEFLTADPNPNLHFHWVLPPRWLDPWDPARGERGIRPHYVLWQRAALSLAAHLHARVGFDIAHHVSWGSASRPPLLWRLPIPFVWGPVGGGQVAPNAFHSYFGSWWRREKLRTGFVRAARFRPVLHNAARRAALVLATNQETRRMLEDAGAKRVEPFLDSGLAGGLIVSEWTERTCEPVLRLLWAGRLEPRKCLPLALEALARVKDLPFKLRVAGNGPMRQEWGALAARMGLEGRVEFLGLVPHPEMPALYRSADAFIFTSLRDSFGSVVLEAMGAGLPIVTLDHQGVGAFVPPEAGFKVPVTKPEETVAGLADAIRALAESPELRARMGRAAWEFAKTQTWERRAEQMTELYKVAIARYREREAGRRRRSGHWWAKADSSLRSE
jgi:glycosyltransferase involved in cell wall biosynthesis